MQLEWILALAALPCVLALGLLNEVIPRWLILCSSTIVLTVLTKFIRPMTGFGWFVVQLASRVAFYGLLVNPLVNDFIQKETRGVGVAIEVSGYIFGQLIAAIVLAAVLKSGHEFTGSNISTFTSALTGLTGVLSALALVSTHESRVSRTYGVPLKQEDEE
jgi:hypothetical protein